MSQPQLQHCQAMAEVRSHIDVAIEFERYKSMAESQAVGIKTGYTRAAQRLTQHGQWDSAAIELRQQDLKRLALHLWTVEEAGEVPQDVVGDIA